MKLINALLLSLIFAALAYAQAQSKCFLNDGLKDQHRITLTIDGRQVAGEFTVVKEYDPGRIETYSFTGTKSGMDVTVHFTGGKTPDALSSKAARRIVWTLSTKGDAEILRVKLYGMKYDVGLYEIYSADYESCEPGFDTLLKTAQTVSFVKGATTATVPAAFTTQRQRKAFRVNVIKGRRFSVTAPGCAISYFAPDKTPYGEGKAIDVLDIESAPLSGFYLFVISPAGEPGTCSITFKSGR